MSSNTNIGNTPVNQGYVQLIHTGETGGIDGTLRTLYDGDGTASDLQIASNKVKVSTELYIGSKTATEFIQDIVGDMFTTGSYTNITTTYDDTNGNIDLSASGEVTLTGTQTLTNKTLASPTFTGTANGANLTLTGDLTVSGDTIFTNSNTVLIGDAILTLNADETGSPTANAGFEVERGTSTNKTFIWNETDDKWTIGSETFVASTVEANLTGNVTGNVTGSASLNLLKSSNLSDLANVATARTNLGVDAAGTDNSTDVTLVTTSHDYLSLAGQAITLGTIDISDDTNLVGGTGITLTGDTLSTTDSEIVHDNLNGFVANEHKDHSAISITTAASSGLSGGGDITTTRSLSVDVNNLDVQVPALELADKIAIYDNSATETNVATLTQLKAIVNTDTDTNQLTEFILSGDSGTNQTISHNNTLTISGGNGISTSTSATDILSVALGGFSTLIAQSSPAEQDLLVIEEAIGGAIKKVQIGALSSGITIDGTTANGILTYGGVDNIDTESNLTFDGTDLYLPDSSNIKFGDSQDLEIKHDGSNSIIKADGTGNLTIRQDTADKDILLRCDDGSGGIATYLTLDGSAGFTTVQKLMRFDDNVDARFGSSSDLRIRHDGTDSKIDNYTGTLKIRNTLDDADITLETDDGSGGVTPYITLDGSAGYTVASKQIRSNDNVALTAGTDGDLNLVHDGTDSYVENWSGDLYIRNNNNDKDVILQSDDGSGGVTPYITLDGSTTDLLLSPPGNVGIGTTSPAHKLEVEVDTNVFVGFDNSIGGTTGDKVMFVGWGGSNAYGRIQPIHQGTAYKDLVLNDGGGNVGIGTSSPAYKLHLEQVGGVMQQLKATDSNQAYMKFVNSTTGDGQFTDGFLFGLDSDETIAIWNYEATAMRFATSGTERLKIEAGGDVLPGADGTQDLGASSKRWGVVYSADLDLSNEGSQNDVDGTWGSYVIQEGEDDLFLINRRNGKKYKFMLQEVQD